MKNILITGGAGFIGSHLVRHFCSKYLNYQIINLDILSYASDISRLNKIQNNSNYKFVEGDISDVNLVTELFEKYEINNVINLAAESHVDNSIKDPSKFALTNIMGTLNLLNISKESWKNHDKNIFYHVSTDEVYGELGSKGKFTENSPYNPKSPYSASKASSDHLVRAFFHTFDLPIIISNCSNNYGPNQHFEKLIPLTIKKIINNENIPIYGNGKNVRDWIFVQDHVEAIDDIFHFGKPGETFNIGGDNELDNMQVVNTIIDLCDKKLKRQPGSSKKLITYVKDRLGHDFRYAIDNSKIYKDIGWSPKLPFNKGIEITIDSYLEHFNI